MKSWQQRERALRPSRKKSATSASRTAAVCASRSRSRTPTGSGCRTSASRRSTGCSTQQDDIVCERVFLPPKQELAELLASGTPLVTLESQTPVGEFDVFAFSVSFEWDYVNVLTLLRLAGIPRTRAERGPRASADRDWRRRDVRQSRAAGAVCRRHRRRRRRSARARARSRVPRPRRDRDDLLAAAGAASAASTSRRSTSRSTEPTARSAAFAPQRGAGRAAAGRRRPR